MEILKSITKDELNTILLNKTIQIEPDGFINGKTKEIIPVHYGRLFGSMNPKERNQFEAYYTNEKNKIIKSIEDEHKVRFYIQDSSKDKRYITFILEAPYYQYKDHGEMELLVYSYEYTDKNGTSLKEIQRKKELLKRKEQIEKSIKASINNAIKKGKTLSFYNSKTQQKMFSLKGNRFSVYYDNIEEIKYVKVKEELFHQKYLSYLEYRIIIEKLSVNSRIYVYYKNKLFITAVAKKCLIKKDKNSSLLIKTNKKELNNKIAEAEMKNKKNKSIKIVEKNNSIDKIFKFKDVHIEIRNDLIKLIFNDINIIRSIKNKKCFNYGKIVSAKCKEYIDNMAIGNTITVYHNINKCFSGVIQKKLTGEIQFKITEDLMKANESYQKKRIKLKSNNFKLTVNEDKYYFNYTDLNKLRSIRNYELIDIGTDVPHEVVDELLKLTNENKIFVNYLGLNCFELRLSKWITSTKFAVYIIVDNMDKTIKKLNDNGQKSNQGIIKSTSKISQDKSIHKNNYYSDTFIKIYNRYNIVEGIQLINTSHNHSTIGHEVKDVCATFAFYDGSRKQYSTFNIVLHYCEKCKRYFEFRNSFELQLKSIGLQLNDVLTGYYNDNMTPLSFKHIGLSEKSTLGKYGYSVKKGGPSTLERQKIIKYILDNRIMSKSEMKSFLNYLIDFNGKKSNMDDAVSKWYQDINYINMLVLQNKY